jgi:hypothetical protein
MLFQIRVKQHHSSGIPAKWLAGESVNIIESHNKYLLSKVLQKYEIICNPRFCQGYGFFIFLRVKSS